MRWNVLANSTFEHEVPLRRQPLRRWWLGWLQLLCAWVLCMLLCANIALVFAEGLPQSNREAKAGSPAGCAVKGSAAQPEPVHGRRKLSC
jgi:hypothetical protein